MKCIFLMAMLVFLAQCQNKQTNLNGHYVSTNLFNDDSYHTLDIVDSLALFNKNVVFLDLRDTIIIDPITNSFIRSTRGFPFFDIEIMKDTVILHYNDGGEGIIKFIKATPSTSEFFSSSHIEIEPEQYHNESQFKIEGLNIKNIIVGPSKKGILWTEPDSIYIEFENEIFIDLKDIARIGPSLDSDSISNWAIGLHLNKHVPQPVANQLRLALLKNYDHKKIAESRLSDNKLIYIEISVDTNTPD